MPKSDHQTRRGLGPGFGFAGAIQFVPCFGFVSANLI